MGTDKLGRKCINAEQSKIFPTWRIKVILKIIVNF